MVFLTLKTFLITKMTIPARTFAVKYEESGYFKFQFKTKTQ